MKNNSGFSRRIFLYLLVVVFLSVLTLGLFWIKNKTDEYYKEVDVLKKSFSDTKKREIKNKILEIKNSIQWSQDFPLNPVLQTLTKQVNQLKFLVNNSDSLFQSIKDSVYNLRVPVYILNQRNEVLVSFNPFSETGKVSSLQIEPSQLRLFEKNKNESGGAFLFYEKSGNQDSILSVIGYLNNTILPGYKIISEVKADDVENVLKVYLLDSISKLRNSENEYIFINSYNGEALITNGKINKSPVNILKSGNKTWTDIFSVQQSSKNYPEGVFHTYKWLLLSSADSSLKTSYFSYIPKWKWIIGTGFYEDDINVVIEKKRNDLKDEMQNALLNVIYYLIIAALLCYLLVTFFLKSFRKNIELFKNFFEKAAKENVLIDQSKVSYREFKKIAEAANLMVEERKKIISDLNKSEEKFLKAFKNSPDGITITSVSNGTLIDVNESICRITGYSRNEIIGGSIVELKLWDNTTLRNKYIELLTKNGRVHNLDANFRMKSGEIRNGLISGEIIEIDEQQYILSVIRDITEYKNIEKELLSLEHRFRETLENIHLISVLLDLNGNITFCNNFLLKITGYVREEVIGKNWFELFVPETRQDVRQLFLKGLSEGIITPFYENQICRKNGEELIIRFNNTLLRDAKGNIIGSTSIGEDITEQKKMEENLRLNENQLSAIYNTVSDVLYLIAVEQNEVYRFISVNEMFLKVTGLKREQVMNKTINEVIPPSAHEMILNNYSEAINTKQTVSWEEVSEYPTGKKYGLVSVTPTYNANGVCTKLVGSVHDITLIRETENEIRKLNTVLEQRVIERTQQLESSNKELESFSYSISHDLRAPLRAIYGFSQILSTRHRKSLNEEGAQYLDYIVDASVRMEHLINDLLNYSRLGRKSLNMYPVSIKKIAENIYSDFKQQLTNIQATFNLNQNLPEVQGDETLLRQIFTNLVGNAITYRREDELLVINIDFETNVNDVVIKVSDNGIGISKEYWEKIFNVFQRLHSEEKYPGTGIGLATVKKSVTLLGGEVWVESEINKGSTFFIKLPKNIA